MTYGYEFEKRLRTDVDDVWDVAVALKMRVEALESELADLKKVGEPAYREYLARMERVERGLSAVLTFLSSTEPEEVRVRHLRAV